MSMEKMMTSLINQDQDKFNSAFDSEIKSRISNHMPYIAKSITSGMVTGYQQQETEPENGDTINTTEQ